MNKKSTGRYHHHHALELRAGVDVVLLLVAAVFAAWHHRTQEASAGVHLPSFLGLLAMLVHLALASNGEPSLSECAALSFMFSSILWGAEMMCGLLTGVPRSSPLFGLLTAITTGCLVTWLACTLRGWPSRICAQGAALAWCVLVAGIAICRMASIGGALSQRRNFLLEMGVVTLGNACYALSYVRRVRHEQQYDVNKDHLRCMRSSELLEGVGRLLFVVSVL